LCSQRWCAANNAAVMHCWCVLLVVVVSGGFGVASQDLQQHQHVQRLKKRLLQGLGFQRTPDVARVSPVFYYFFEEIEKIK
jgi:hypothetical protein